MSSLKQFLDASRGEFEEELCELLRIRSVSADRQYRGELQRAAEWLLAQFRDLGFSSEIASTEGIPVVYAESPPVPGAPTVLVYGHYDVQPPEPLEEWKSPPFEPQRRKGNLYARGASDDKGQLLTHLKSAQAWLKTAGSLPLQLKYVIEGEEEVGSATLTQFLTEHGDRLACDAVVISDSCQFGPGCPAITYGLRGIAYFEVRLTGPDHDLHSGTFGGPVVNPVNALARLLASLTDSRGRIKIPGFYDEVAPLTDRERQQLAGLPFSERAFKQQIGVTALGGEAGYSTLERRWARPTFDIHGVWGGYQGEGGKTVLPSRAGAKFSFRLVPRQDPKKVAESLRQFLRSRCPRGVRMELVEMHGAPGVVMSLDSPYMAAASAAIERAFGRAPVFIREGGSIPIVTQFRQALGVDVLLLGWGLEDDNTHAPNEKLALEDFHRGTLASAFLWEELSKINKPASDAGSQIHR